MGGSQGGADTRVISVWGESQGGADTRVILVCVCGVTGGADTRMISFAGVDQRARAQIPLTFIHHPNVALGGNSFELSARGIEALQFSSLPTAGCDTRKQPFGWCRVLRRLLQVVWSSECPECVCVRERERHRERERQRERNRERERERETERERERERESTCRFEARLQPSVCVCVCVCVCVYLV